MSNRHSQRGGQDGSFADLDLGLPDARLRGLVGMRMTTPTRIQKACIEQQLREETDMIVRAILGQYPTSTARGSLS